MISLNWDSMQGEVGALMARFEELPRHIAKKHLIAALNRVLKDGVPILKSVTPKGSTKIVRSGLKRNSGGRFVSGSGKKMRVRGGALRRAATSKAKFVGRNRDGVVYGVVGYKAGFESRKAIWLEFGTSRGIQPRNLIEQFRSRYGGPAASRLAEEMSHALEKAANELAAGLNPTRSYGR